MNFILKLSVDSKAFQPTPYAETARLLRAIADRLDNVKPPRPKQSGSPMDALYDYADRGWTGHYQTLLDANGEDVGRYAFKVTD